MILALRLGRLECLILANEMSVNRGVYFTVGQILTNVCLIYQQIDRIEMRGGWSGMDFQYLSDLG